MLAPKRSHSSRQIYRPSPEPRLRVEKKGSNRWRSISGAIGGPSLSTDNTALASSRAARRRQIAPGCVAGVALRVVEQVDEHAAQVFRVEPHGQRRDGHLHAQAAACARGQLRGARPVGRGRGHLGRGIDGARSGRQAGRNLGHVVDQALEARHVVGHHARQPLLGRRQLLLQQQRVGLRDGGQRVADLVRDAGRDAAHGRQLLLPDARLKGAQVFEQQHGERLAGMVFGRRVGSAAGGCGCA